MVNVTLIIYITKTYNVNIYLDILDFRQGLLYAVLH